MSKMPKRPKRCLANHRESAFDTFVCGRVKGHTGRHMCYCGCNTTWRNYNYDQSRFTKKHGRKRTWLP